MILIKTPQCDICQSKKVSLIFNFDKPLSITSDLRVWNKEVKVFQCLGCGYIFKRPTKYDLDKIYQSYQLFEDTETRDQAIFIPGLPPRSRSELLIKTLSGFVHLPNSGIFLDIGCNKGFLLREFSSKFPHWSVFGHEASTFYESFVKKIPRFGGFYSGDLGKIKERFDLISMVHTLEHINNPSKFLSRVRGLLNTDGSLLIQVPNYSLNAFDILVFEHVSHFSSETLEQLLINCGFEVVAKSIQVVPKELTFVSKIKNGKYNKKLSSTSFLRRVAKDNIKFLKKFEKLVIDAKNKKPLVVFGTAEVGILAAGLLDFKFDFFIDESPWRVGKTHFDIPIKHPKVLKPGDNVILAVAPIVARYVYSKWRKSGANFLYPQALD